MVVKSPRKLGLALALFLLAPTSPTNAASLPDAFSLTVGAVTDGTFTVTNHDTGDVCTTNIGTAVFVVDLINHQGFFTAASQCGLWSIQFPVATCGLRTPYDGIICQLTIDDAPHFARIDSRLPIRDLLVHDFASSNADWRVHVPAAVGLR